MMKTETTNKESASRPFVISRTFDAWHESIKGGWPGTFDPLARYLAKA